MDLSEILAITGKPGLYRMVSQTKNSIIVESLEDKKRFPAFSTDRISALEDISIYTESSDVPLRDVLNKIAENEDKGKCISHKEDNDELKIYFKQILPDYDEERVYISDIKKIFRWYNTIHDLELMEVLETPVVDDDTENVERKSKVKDEEPKEEGSEEKSTDEKKEEKE